MSAIAFDKIVYRSDYTYGNGLLHWRPSDGKIYSSMRGRVLRIDPSTREHEIFGTYPGLSGGIALSGKHLYSFKGTRLVRFRIE
ncbi:hypothetical protein H8D79_01250 [PVC group bacterium]|nr:hypothetical protein [PVC group bacterium]